MLSYTCTNGGQEITAATRQELDSKIASHNAIRHGEGQQCRPLTLQGVAPLQRAYYGTDAHGVTERGIPA